MSVAKRSDGRYIVKYKDANGNWKQRSFKLLRDAERFDQGVVYDQPENSRLTLGEAVLLYLKNKRSELSAHRIGIYEYAYKTATTTLTDKYADSLTRRDLETLRNNIKLSNNKISNTTINIYVRCFITSMNWCVEQELLKDNSWAKYKPLKSERPKSRTCSIEDFQAIYSKLPDWAQWFCTTVINLCLRPGKEVINLTWNSFNWSKNCVTVYMYKTNTTKLVYVSNEYMSQAKTKYEASRSNYVCPHNGKKIYYKTFTARWYSVCVEVGVAVPPYTMRHIAASQLLAIGVDIATVASQLGHANPTTTAKYYLHSTENAQKQAGAKLGALFDKILDK